MLVVLGIIVLGLAAALVVYLSIHEYNPPSVEDLTVSHNADTPLYPGTALRIVTCNTGYGGLSADTDFFMDGGSHVNPASEEAVSENLAGIGALLGAQGANVYMLQEVDLESSRSFDIDEAAFYENTLGLPGVFAYNYNCVYVPYPLPPIGKVGAGLLTLTRLHAAEAQRISLPVPFEWPIRTANLKRCLLVERIPVEGTDRELVLVNLHLEAYDDGGGKAAQTEQLYHFLEIESLKGNYVIAGGDFNQTFPGSPEFPVVSPDSWVPGVLDEDSLPYGYSYVFDPALPTTRVLNAPYTGSWETSQVYTIDGFIVSDNLSVLNVAVVDDGFRYTDHQAVVLDVVLP
ncbi:MAG: endonuclease/exonuclease/phosphatase family protein [Clostridia bacterium]|nr:endonuclease/exonuclease/phosphatase family protein [Clostridia bacterium]